jgi:uncharacterized RDD family membrane protein YckC
MTYYPPPPPPGSYPPPPPGAYYPPPQWVLPTGAYTPWFTRVLASLIDWIPILLVFILPMIGLLVTDAECFDATYGSGRGDCGSSSSLWWIAVQGVGFLALLPYFLWNFCYRQGKSGQSIGKSVLKFKVVSEKTWQPIGFWLSLVRQIAHYIDQLICYVGYLFPLWDDKRQTIADKLMNTVCVPLNPQPLPPQPPQY